MVAEKGASQEGRDNFGVGRHDEFTETERGYYSQALRKGQVRRPPPNAPRLVNTLLRVLNIVSWLILMAFIAWRVYLFYL
jgi:hypothetical protein